MSTAPHSLSAQNLVKEFPAARKERVRAVDDLSFVLQAGESVAFLGPNGAGKSTTIKMLCGILRPTSGVAEIAGHAAGSMAANRQIGLVFGTRSQLFMHMTVQQCLELIGEIYFLHGAAKKKRIYELADLFEIGALLPKRVRILSLGQRMRCELVAALLHRPKILLADEPTIGLDVIAKNRLRELILRWQKEERSTLLLTSHDLSDVEALCERCILIDHGQKQFDGRLMDLKGDLADIRRIQITVAHDHTPLFHSDRLITSKVSDEFVHLFEVRKTDFPIAESLALLSKHYGDDLQDIQISDVNLEEVLSHRYKEGR